MISIESALHKASGSLLKIDIQVAVAIIIVDYVLYRSRSIGLGLWFDAITIYVLIVDSRSISSYLESLLVALEVAR